MTELARWVTREFPTRTDVALHPNVRSRLAGAPARLEELVRWLPAATRADRGHGGWSIQTNAGHLLDLEELWRARVEDLLAGRDELTPWEVTNEKTEAADHDATPVDELCAGFRAARGALVARLAGLTDADFEREARHPRLGTAMRLVDLCAFVGEHDDHHLARIAELRRSLLGGMRGTLEAIHVRSARGEAAVEREQVRAFAGVGLEGDRYAEEDQPADRAGDPGRHVTLIAVETGEAVAAEGGQALTPGESRRNLTTRGVDLNALVGLEFRVGEARLRGVRLCHPCAHLESTTRPGMLADLANRGGLRAEILEGGVLRLGDEIAVC